ncbi:hypothetical protein ACVRXQ_03545 [Streptococcus panodentis]|uniref:Dimethyladenosine transferase n=1 Tax=Streptococcus panodentis TaxID=1581472 RepID=A0ABS5AZI3_9STRE|nr:hypothetical protein [Streptococcus panodentis]MBP2621831.1 hypothetical protein [Streptococcus panodentis]
MQEGLIENAVFYLQNPSAEKGTDQAVISENDEEIPDFWYFLWDQESLEAAIDMWRLGGELLQHGHLDRFDSLDQKQAFELRLPYEKALQNAQRHRNFIREHFPDAVSDYDVFVQLVELNGRADDVCCFDLSDLLYLEEDFEPAMQEIRAKFKTLDQNLQPGSDQFRMTEDLKLYATGDMVIYAVGDERKVTEAAFSSQHLNVLERGDRDREAEKADQMIGQSSSDGQGLAIVILLVLLVGLLFALGIIHF